MKKRKNVFFPAVSLTFQRVREFSFNENLIQIYLGIGLASLSLYR
jgi:hypothetical protein